MKLIVFDVDGTLVDSQNLIVEAQRMAFGSLGLPAPSRERALSVVGLSLIEAFNDLTDGEGPSDLLAQAYKDAWSQLRVHPGFHDPLYPGARELLAELAHCDDCMLGLATGKSRAGVRSLLERHGWQDMFDTIQTADDAPSKPAPDMFLRALSETGVGARNACMIGDTTFDMVMAHSAGAHAIGVGWGYHRHDKLKKAGAAQIVPDFPALREALDEFRQCVTI
ncbi:MAG TPA: HAD-IA family hydrolase [Rhodoblastus sp.]|nr:HAD-IA family hydrolase [Rhodoblastus sp.]